MAAILSGTGSFRGAPRTGAVLSFDVLGDEAMCRRLRVLSDVVLPKIVRPALRQAAGLIAKVQRRHLELSKETGTLQQSIGVRVWTNPTRTACVAYVGPRRRMGRLVKITQRGKRRVGKRAWDKEGRRHVKPKGTELRIPTRYAHLVERVKPFIESAMDEVADVAVCNLRALIMAGIERETAKLGGR
jgi:hypothetical protein